MSKVPVHILANTEFEKISITVDLAEERDEQVKYRIRLILDTSEYVVYREYKQFKDLYSNLRFQFPKLELPSFPSKYALYNIKESRRKSFDKLLKTIVSIGKKLPSLSKKEIKRILIDFIAENKQTNSSQLSKEPIVEAEQVKSSSGVIMSFMDVKLDEEDWITYYASLISNDIYFFPDDNKDSYFSMVICILGTQLSVLEAEGVIEVHHPYEKKPILLKTRNWKDWKDQLIVVSSQAGKSQDYKKKSIGRMIVKIYSGQNIKTVKPPTGTVKPHSFVHIELGGLAYQTSILPQDDIINWNQTFILPMFNRFFIVKLSICRFSSEGWIKQTRKDDVLDELSIPIIDLNQYPYIKGPVIHKQLTVMLGKPENVKKDEESSCINLDVIHEYGFIGNFVPPPTNYIEENVKVEKASLDDFKIVSKRLKRIRIVYEEFFNQVGHIFSWKYPKISGGCMSFYIICAIFLPSQLALPLIIFLLTVFCYAMSPYCDNFRKRIKQKYLTITEDISIPVIKTQKESDFAFKQEFKNFNEKDKEGILDTYKKIRVDIDELMEILIEVVSIAEKLRTLFMWEDPQKSLYFCFGLVIVIYLLYSIPFRLLVLIIGIGKFLDGKKTSEKKKKNNSALAKEILSSIFSLVIADYTYDPLKDDPFPIEFTSNPTAQKRVIKSLRTRLALDINVEIFQICFSPSRLFNAISSIEVLLKMRTEDGHISERSKKQSTNPITGFVANIPSEYYRFKYPRVKNIQAAN